MSTRTSRSRQRGLSIVELMVGVTVGLFVVAAAAMLVSTQLSSNRQLLLDTQLQQDLRATADLVARELRRVGALEDQRNTLEWKPASLGQVSVVTGTSGSVNFRYERTPDLIGDFGFALVGGVIRTKVAGGSLQDLTDNAVLTVTRFEIEATDSANVVVPCPNLCPSPPAATPDASCWPRVNVREYRVTIAGQSRHDPRVERSVVTHVRARNDWIRSPAGTNPTCPS